MLGELAALMTMIAGCLGEWSPYAPDPRSLRQAADAALGLYAGAFGRYRAGRRLPLRRRPRVHRGGLHV
jgi:hypothetical protein